MCVSTHVACCHVRHNRCNLPSETPACFRSSPKAYIAFIDSIDHINSDCACIQISGKISSSRHYRSATAFVMLFASGPCHAIHCVAVAH